MMGKWYLDPMWWSYVVMFLVGTVTFLMLLWWISKIYLKTGNCKHFKEVRYLIPLTFGVAYAKLPAVLGRPFLWINRETYDWFVKDNWWWTTRWIPFMGALGFVAYWSIKAVLGEKSDDISYKDGTNQK